MLTLPSVKSLLSARLADTPAEARALRQSMRKARAFCDAGTLPPATAAWARSCYNPPDTGELRMAIADELTHGHGVETLIDARGRWVADYVNHGDTYAPTIVRTRANCYRVACWGDLVEAAERRSNRFS